MEQQYSPNPYQGRIGHGDIRKFADATRFHLRAAHQIAGVLFIGRGPTEESVENLLRRLETGLPAEALALLNLPLTLSRGEYLALSRARVLTPEAVWALPDGTLKEILGDTTAARLEKVRPTLA